MVKISSQSTVNKIEMRLRGKGRGSIVFQQDYADCRTPSAVKSTFHRTDTKAYLTDSLVKVMNSSKPFRNQAE